MKVTYDTRTDTLTVQLKDGTAITESDEDKPGIVLDYDAEGDLVAVEILDASVHVSEADKVEFHTVE